MKLLIRLKDEFCKRFKIEDCGEAGVFLRLEIRRDRSKRIPYLGQTRYTEKVLELFGMLNNKPVVSPMDGQIIQSDLEEEPFDTTVYIQAIGCLMYLSVGSCPDIFSVTRLAQYVENPTTQL